MHVPFTCPLRSLALNSSIRSLQSDSFQSANLRPTNLPLLVLRSRMAISLIHVLDRNYDTVIVLKHQVVDFAPWVPPPEPLQPIRRYIEEVSSGLKKAQLRRLKKGTIWREREARFPAQEHEETSAMDSIGHTTNLVTSSAGLSGQHGATISAESSSSVLPLAEKVAANGDDGIRYHVSSRHLMLASPWFERALMNKGWSESSRSEEDGRFHVAAEDWDAEAFLLVLNTFHLKNKQIPRTLTLEMLSKVAVLVDYYDCREAIEPWTAMWIMDLKFRTAIPSIYCRDLILWLWVAWVLEEEDQFQRASAVAIQQSTESVQTLGLPIPARVSGEIDSKRYQAIESVIEGLHSLLERYRSSDYVCATDSTQSFQCGSFLLGALTKQLDANNLLSPRPEVPFHRFSVDGLCSEVEAMKSPDWVMPNNRCTHLCTLDTEVVTYVAKSKAFIAGLELDLIKKGASTI